MKGKRGVMKLWLAIVLVFVGIIAIAGVTVLVLYLTGRFEGETIEPENISFSQELGEDDLGFYDSSMSSTNMAYYRVSSDFDLTITTTTENVTERDVTLSLNGGVVSNGYVSNGIIRVPQVVSLNRPFTVELVTNYNSEIGQDWVVGGISTITASSENVMLTRIMAQIAVDVPVYDINVRVLGNEQFDTTQEVVVGTNFTLETQFVPDTSKNNFSSSQTKEILYDFSSSYISLDYETGTFFAEAESGSETARVTVYTFSNSYHQTEIMNMFSSITDREDLTANVLAYFNTHTEACVTQVVEIAVRNVEVDSVQVGNAGSTFNATVDEYFTITANNRETGDATLGLSILDSQDTPYSSLFGNVGIKIPTLSELTEDTSLNSSDINFRILGGRVIKVETVDGVTTITQGDFDPTFDYVANSNETTSFYVLANTTPAEYANYYWRISAEQELSTSLHINFFNTYNGEWQNFFDFGDERMVNINIEFNSFEEPVPWLDQTSEIQLEITYDEEGNPVEDSVNLSEFVGQINSENTYTLTRYFIYTNDALLSGTLTDLFDCNAGQSYTTDYRGEPLTISNSELPLNGMFYELNGSILTALRSFEGTVKVVVAIVRTDADNMPIYEDGKYQIVNFSSAKEISVDSTLSFANMEASFNFDQSITAYTDGNFYVPAINVDDDGGQADMIYFTLTLTKSENVDLDSQKLLNAFNEGSLKVNCLDLNGNVTDDLVLTDFVESERADNSVTYVGTLSITENNFQATEGLDRGKNLRLQLEYFDGNKTFTELISMEGDAEINNFFVYYQQPQTITGAYESNTNLDANGDGNVDEIQVNITASGIDISWGNVQLSGATMQETLEQLNSLLTFTLHDQYGREIDTATNTYDVRFVEETDGSPILSFDSSFTQIQGFSSAKDADTSLVVYVVDRQNNDDFVHVNGGSTGEYLTSEQIFFNVTSEGVSNIRFDDSPILNQTDWQDNVNPDGTPNLSVVQVEKYVAEGQSVNPSDLIRIYINNSDVPETNLNIKLDASYVSGLSTQTRTAIMDVIWFNNAHGSMEDFVGTDGTNINTISAIGLFNEDRMIRLSVSDANNALFTITLELTFKQCAQISTTGFTNYATEERAPYLVSSGSERVASVFANESYDLDEFLPINMLAPQEIEAYTWSGVANPTGILVDNSGSGLLSLSGGNGTPLMLNIASTFEMRQIQFTIYYGVSSTVALRAQVTLYINPNLIIRESVSALDENPLIDLQTLSAERPAGDFGFFLATDFIDEGIWTPITISDLTYNNTDTEGGVLAIQMVGDELRYVIQSGDLSLELGANTIQNFTISRGTAGSTRYNISGIILKTVSSENEISEIGSPILCEVGELLELTFAIGYGGSDETSTIQSVFAEQIPTVTYNGRTHLILISGESYNFIEGASLDTASLTGDLTQGSNGRLGVSYISGFFSPTSATENTFSVIIPVQDGEQTLNVRIAMKAIVSRIGTQFVYYNNDTDATTEDMIFNAFEDVDFATLIGGVVGLEQAGVYQELNAGNNGTPYTMVHDMATEGENVSQIEPQDAFGFYYNSDIINTNVTTTLEVVSAVGHTVGEQVNLPGLAEIVDGTKLQINHISTDYDEIYVVLRFTITENGSGATLSWNYRIKVNPSFSAGEVTYPYAQDVEYLDTTSSYYIAETGSYQIDLSEELNFENSRFVGGVYRFIDPTFTLGVAETLTTTYVVDSVLVDGIPTTNYSSLINISHEGDVLTITPTNSTSEITLTICKNFLINGKEAIGGGLRYTFAFNQGETYEISLTGGNVQGSTPTYSDTVKASGNIDASASEISYNVRISISNDSPITQAVNFDAYIAEMTVAEDGQSTLSSALNSRAYLPAGTILTTVDGIGTLELERNYFPTEWTWGGTSTTTITIGQTQYQVNQADVQQTYFALSEPLSNSSRTLTISPRSAVDKDYQFEIGFYTEQKQVGSLYLTVTGIYNPQLNTDATFVGGTTYSYLQSSDEEPSMSGIFSSLGEEFDVNDTFTIAVNNGTTALENGVLLDDLVIVDDVTQTIEFAHLTQDVTFKFIGTITSGEGAYSFEFEMSVESSFNLTTTYSYARQNAMFDGQEYTINMSDISNRISAFADVGSNTFEFRTENEQTGDAEDGDETSLFSYSETTTLTPRFSATFNIDDVNKRESQRQNYVVACLFGDKEIFTVNMTYSYTIVPNINAQINYPNPDGNGNVNTEYVGTTQQSNEQYSSGVIENFFSTNALLASGDRVSITAQNGGTVDTTTSVKIQNWSVSIASMSAGLTLNVASIGNFTSESILNNATIFANVNLNTDPDNPVENTVTDLTDNFTFTLASGTSEAQITFLITVNSIWMNYTVTVVQGGNVLLRTYAPNMNGSVETIYAEDVASNTEQTIFATNRILNYQIRTGGTYYVKFVDSTNPATTRIFTISGNANESPTNIDLGESLVGFEYVGTYTSRQLTAEGALGDVVESSRISDEEMGTYFQIIPNLTSRVVTIYYDGTPITIDGVSVQYNTSTTGEAIYANLSTYQLSSSSLDNQQTIRLYIKVGDENPVDTTNTYSFVMRLDFDVANNADTFSNAIPYTQEIVAQNNGATHPTLLSFEEFGIRSSRTGQLYTAETMATSGGRITLQQYGFSTLPVAIDDSSEGHYGDDSAGLKLAQAAGELHEYLLDRTFTNATSGETYKFHTGLVPRAYGDGALYEGDDINDIAPGNNTYNYIVLTAQGTDTPSSDRATDWTIWAQGANNDGNYVMMKLTYSVVLSNGETVSTSHNILFKVITTQDASSTSASSTDYSTITFKQYAGTGTATVASNNSHTNGVQSYASNVDNPYQIHTSNLDGGIYTFNLFGSSTGDDTVINTYMRGSATSSANNFSYTYTFNQIDSANSIEYNEWTLFNGKNRGLVDEIGSDSRGAFTDTDWEPIYTTSGSGSSDPDIEYTKLGYQYSNSSNASVLSLTVPGRLALGEKHFFVDFTDNFGFKGRFYFTIVSEDNPEIEAISTTRISEGSQIVFGAQYTTMTPEQSYGYISYESFKYTKYDQNNGEGEPDYAYMNNIKINVEDGIGTSSSDRSDIISSVQIRATLAYGDGTANLNSGDVIYRTIDTSEDSTYSIDIVEDETAGDWTKIGADGEDTDAEFTITQDVLEEADIQFLIQLKSDISATSLGRYRAVYSDSDLTHINKPGEITLRQNYVLGNVSRPNFEDLGFGTDDDVVEVTLRGISAYGINVANVMAYDENSLSREGTTGGYDYHSTVDQIYVKEVSFYIDGAERETATVEDAGSSWDGAKLITDDEYVFIESDLTQVVGVEESEGNTFTVPNFDGILFGRGNTISDVVMRVDLEDETGNTHTLYQNVTIVRESDTPSFTTDMTDGENVGDKAPSGAEIYNDTLEVKLQPQESISFVVHNSAVSGFAVDEEGNTTMTVGDVTLDANVITVTNSNSYASTFYYSISDAIVGLEQNLETNNTFYVYVLEHQIGGRDVTTEDNLDVSILYNTTLSDAGNSIEISRPEGSDERTKTVFESSGRIATLTSGRLQMNIEDVDECVPGTNYKSEEIYFLYNANGEFYRFSQTFHVYPRFTGAEASNDNSILVGSEDYYTVSNGTDEYYIITLDKWASEIKLTPGVWNDRDAYMINFTDQIANLHQFRFEVISTSGASAFIDENGMITTGAFETETGYINVRIYMKVGGFNGQFEDDDTDILLNQTPFTIRLETSSASGVTTGEGVYYNTIDGVHNIITVPKDYTLYGASLTQISSFSEITTTYSCAVGGTLNLHDLFDDSASLNFGDYYNKTYHIVGIGTETEISTYHTSNNLNSWTFDTVGTREVYVVMTGRNGSTPEILAFRFTVLVYDDSGSGETQNNYYLINRNETNTQSLAGVGEEWWLLGSDSTTQQVTEFTATGDGVFNNTYLVFDTEANTQQIVNAHFFAYGGETIYKSVALLQGEGYNLYNLISSVEDGFEHSYRIYRIARGTNNSITSITEQSTETINRGYGTVVTGYYLVLDTYENSYEETVSELRYYEVTFKIVQSGTGESLSAYAPLTDGGISQEDVYEAVKNALGLQIENNINMSGSGAEEIPEGAFFTLQAYANNGNLTTVGNLGLTGNAYQGRFLATYRATESGTPAFTTINMTFYSYTENVGAENGRFSLDVAMQPSSAFEFSNMNAFVREAVGAGTDDFITYYVLNGNSLAQINSMDLQENQPARTYYVCVGDTYYLFDITFNILDGYTGVDLVSNTQTITLETADIENGAFTWSNVYGKLTGINNIYAVYVSSNNTMNVVDTEAEGGVSFTVGENSSYTFLIRTSSTSGGVTTYSFHKVIVNMP